jgi:phosphatidate cytidylyltransferase
MSMSNGITRLLVALLGIPLILAACYFGKIYFLIFCLGIALLSFYEFSQFVKNKGIKVNIWLGYAAIILLVSNRYAPFFDNFNFLILFVVVISLIELFRNNGSAIYNLGGTLLGVLYLGLFASSLVGIREFYPAVDGLYYRGGYIIISVFISIWMCDSAAYYGGTALGKHKLFPRVSPKKSWEGAIFGFVFSIIAMVIARFLILDFLSWSSIIILGVIIGIIGQLGDLIESLFKRDAVVKDSSNIIPGHGGIFDRFDSLLYTAPVIFLYLMYINR